MNKEEAQLCNLSAFVHCSLSIVNCRGCAMSDDLTQLPPAVDPPADEPTAPVRADLTAQQALELIRQGKPVENARVRKLRFRGAFDTPVRFKNCTLVHPEF